ncbi:hypothetical protein [Pseudoalteromonas sp. Of11M-6]|uniref:hypothetical protein n=1 Tax=Pseudoalteromonas sp. Of11M-6 TaxID=2917754 RepID=UPI001EF4E3B5|nr:hypothetical protein [Pseudoalteromonas sp. Of11M-6]MCG7556258.1 hypothetical protein [Pseudoalteromonas sp. Of11M-6]
MNPLKSFGKILLESILETMEEGVGTTDRPENDYDSENSFSNSYRLNGDNDIATSFEGENSADNGGQWVRKE